MKRIARTIQATLVSCDGPARDVRARTATSGADPAEPTDKLMTTPQMNEYKLMN